MPTTEDEKEDFGEFDREGAGNLARKYLLQAIIEPWYASIYPWCWSICLRDCRPSRYIDDTRRRKGLWVEEKIVESADKQRNRSVRK